MTERNRVGPLTANLIAKLFQPGATSQGAEGETKRVAQNDVDGPAETAAQAIKAGANWATEEDKNRLLTLSPMNAEFMGYGRDELVTPELPDPRGLGPTPWTKGIEGTRGREANEPVAPLEGTPEERNLFGIFGEPDSTPTPPLTADEVRRRLMGPEPVKPLDLKRALLAQMKPLELERFLREQAQNKRPT